RPVRPCPFHAPWFADDETVGAQPFFPAPEMKAQAAAINRIQHRQIQAGALEAALRPPRQRRYFAVGDMVDRHMTSLPRSQFPPQITREPPLRQTPLTRTQSPPPRP